MEDQIIINSEQKIILLGEFVSRAIGLYPNQETFNKKVREYAREIGIKPTTKYTNKMFPGAVNL